MDGNNTLTINEYGSMNGLIFADSGGGKTTLLGTIHGDPRFMPAILLDIDGGSRSIKSKILPLVTGEGRAQKPDMQGFLESKYKDVRPDLIHCLKIRKWVNFEDAFAYLNDPDEPGNIYKTVMIDSGTTLNDLSIDDIVETARAKDLKRAAQRDAPQIDEFGDNLNRMRKLVSRLKDWPVNVFMTALCSWDRDDVEKIWTKDADFTGKLSKKLPALFENNFFLKIEHTPDGPKRVIQFQADDQVRAKARDEFGLLGFKSDILSLPYILDRLQSNPTTREATGS